jgi:signal transduction histidine kinase
MRLRTLDGREVDISTSTAPLRDAAGHPLGAVTILHDQTERKRLERESEAARANELAVREVNQRLDTFVGVAAHDLRTPLAVSRMVLERAQMRLQHPAPQAVADGSQDGVAPTMAESPADRIAARALETVGRQLDRLSRLVEQLLDVARIRKGSLALERRPCDLVDLVRECVEEQRLLAPERTIALTLPGPDAVDVAAHGPDAAEDPDAGGRPILVEADADRLGQVVTNYLTNALRYAPEDQPVEVRVRVVGEEATHAEGGGTAADLARVEVRDHGPGIPPEEQEAIWERFQRAPSVQGGTGVGLGLYIARLLVEQQGGRVGVESAPGQGSTFWFTLPLAPAVTALGAARGGEEASEVGAGGGAT